MKRIPIHGGHAALVDDADFAAMSRHTWSLLKTRGGKLYATRRVRISGHGKNRVRICVLMHRELLGITERSVWVDHKNGNGLDNRRRNIRRATPAQNGHHKKKYGPSPFRGVSLHSGKWWAKIVFHKKQISLGYHDTPALAALAYDRAAKQYYGKFATTNVTLGLLPPVSP